MLAMLRDLMAHKAYANAALLLAIDRNEAAARDADLLALLDHVLLANRFWLLSIEGRAFVADDEGRPSPTLEALTERYRATHEEEAAFLETMRDGDLERALVNPLIPGGRCTVAQALMQVCLHSLGHRSQCAKLLRRHGGVPPSTDFILWLKDRPRAEWPGASRKGT